MPVEVRYSPPPLHEPGEHNVRPKGILKNPSFSAPSGQSGLPLYAAADTTAADHHALSDPRDPEEEKDLTLQNTLQNAGPRRSSSTGQRASVSRRQSSAAQANHDDDPEKMRLKWDEANLYLAEQESGGRMKITEPKTPYQYGDQGAMDEEEEDVAIDPRYVNVDEVDMANNKSAKKHRTSEIPGLELGEPEDEFGEAEDDGLDGEESRRLDRGASLSREHSKEKHVSVSNESGEGMAAQVGMPTQEEQEKHRHFEEQRKRHYEMKNIKGLLGHPEDMDIEDGDASAASAPPTSLPDRGMNGTR